MMTLTHYENLGNGAKLDYTVTHSTPGREGTTLTAYLTLCIRQDKSWCELKVEDCEGTNQKEALDRMSSWLRRLADGIDQRRELTLPM